MAKSNELKVTLGGNERKTLVVENPTVERLDLVLASGSSLELDLVENRADNPDAHLIINAALAADSRLKLTAVAQSSVRVEINIDLNGPGAEATLNGVVLADGRDKVGFATNVSHHAHHTSSAQLFKYICDGQSHCSFCGRIAVDETARFTAAHQTNRNLVASDSARMHAEPTLEIYCDEVQCSHGAATGQLDENALFYMRQRGIDLPTARRMLMQAFAAEVIDRVSDEKLRNRLQAIVNSEP